MLGESDRCIGINNILLDPTTGPPFPSFMRLVFSSDGERHGDPHEHRPRYKGPEVLTRRVVPMFSATGHNTGRRDFRCGKPLTFSLRNWLMLGEIDRRIGINDVLLDSTTGPPFPSFMRLVLSSDRERHGDPHEHRPWYNGPEVLTRRVIPMFSTTDHNARRRNFCCGKSLTFAPLTAKYDPWSLAAPLI